MWYPNYRRLMVLWELWISGSWEKPINTPISNLTATTQDPPKPTVTSLEGTPEQITGIVQFVEQGLLSVIHYTLIVTSQRLIFCTWNPNIDEIMSDTHDEVMLESCNIDETTGEIAHFRAKSRQRTGQSAHGSATSLCQSIP